MHQNEKKREAALAALQYIPDGAQLGVGTGSTVNHFIDALPDIRNKIDSVASSSDASTERL
jgi:ribose 5-phosphate isomerase A